MDNSLIMEFNVSNQVLTRIDTRRVVEDSANYLYAHFNFSSDWNNIDKFIIVENKQLDLRFKVAIDAQNKVKIPSSVIKHNGFSLMVVGQDENNYIVITTTTSMIQVLKTNYSDAEEEYIRNIISQTLTIIKEGDVANIEIPDVYFIDSNLTNDVLNFLNRNNEILKSIGMPYGKIHNISISIDNDNYKLTLNAFDKDNNLLFSREADFDIESKAVSNFTYDAVNKTLILTLQNGGKFEVSIASLINGLQPEINENNKVSSAYIDDTNSANKFVSQQEKNQITANKNAIEEIEEAIPTKTSDLTNDSDFIDETYHDNTKQDVLTGSESIDLTGNIVSVKDNSIDYSKLINEIKLNNYGLNTDMKIENLTSGLEQGGFDLDGFNIPSTNRLRIDNFISVKPNTKYIIYTNANINIKQSISFYAYNAYPYSIRLSFVAFTNGNVLSFTTPKNCYYVRLLIAKQNDTTITTSEIIASYLITNFNNEAIINNEINTNYDECYINDTKLNDYIRNKLYVGWTWSGNRFTYAQSDTPQQSGDFNNRIATLYLAKFDYDITVIADRTHRFSIQYFSNNSVNALTFISNSNWQTKWVIPANTYFGVVISRQDNENCSESDILGVNFYMQYNNLVGTDLLKKNIKTQTLGILTYLQAFCIYNGKYYSTDGTHISVQDTNFNEINNVALNIGHANSFQLGNSNLAYSSGWDDNKIYVINLDTLTIVNTITLPTTGYTTCAVDEDNGLIYIFQRDDYPSSLKNYNFIVYDYVNDTTISTITTSFKMAYQQATIFKNGKIFITWGMGDSLGNGHIVVDTNCNVLANYNFNSYVDQEPEGIAFDSDNELYISFVNKNLIKILKV